MKDLTNNLPTHPELKYATRPLSDITDVIIHHTATRSDLSVEAIAKYHISEDPTRNKEPYAGIGYHIVIPPNGSINLTNMLTTISAHAGVANSYSVGIALIGNFMSSWPTEAQLVATRNAIRWIEDRVGRKLIIEGHKEAQGARTACPGDTWDDWYKRILPMEKTGSKLGAYFQGEPERKPGAENDVTEIVRASNIQVVKGINITKWPEPPKDMFPGKRFIARSYIEGGDSREWNEFVVHGAKGADAYFELLKPRYEKLRSWGVTDISGPNEPHPQNAEDYRVVDEFDTRWAYLAHDWGFAPWVGRWGIGWPHKMEFIHLLSRSVELAIKYGGGIEKHEYGAPEVLSGEGWWTLRYRRTVEELRKADVEFPPGSVFIGECGIDGGVIDWKQPPWNKKRHRRGWREWSREWVYPEQYGLPAGLLTVERYFRQLRAYDKELLKDDYVLAATPFITIPFDDWKDFNVGPELLKRISAAHEEAPPVPVPPEPPEPPEPTPDDLEERVAALENIISSLRSWLDNAPL